MPPYGDSVEIRSFSLRQLSVEDEEQRLIVGYAAVFNQISEDLGGFREIIEPGFFDEVLGDDVRALWNHNDDMVLGRTKSGTLRLAVDTEGLRVETDPPETTWANDALISMRRGDVDQMSFGFRVRRGGDEWIEQEDGTVLRRLLPGGCERLYDISPVCFPAYPQTSVEARSMARQIEANRQEGQEPPPGNDEEETTARARLDLQRRRLDLAEARYRIQQEG